MVRRRDVLKTGALGLVGSTTLAGCLGGEEEFPSQDITVILGFGEGGGTHALVEDIRDSWEEELGVNLRLDFRPGAGTQIGLEGVLNADPDGYTVGNITFPHAIFTELIFDAPYSIPDDFGLLGGATTDPSSVIIPSDEDRYSDLPGLIQYASENPGDLSVSTSGPFSVASLAMVAMERETGAEFNFVPFDGGGAARSAVVSGEVDLSFTNVFASQGVADETDTIGVYAEENIYGDLADNAPTIYEALDISTDDVPPASFDAQHFMTTSAEVGEEYPDRLEFHQDAFETAHENWVSVLEEEGEGRDLWSSYMSPEDGQQHWEDGMGFYQEWVPILEDRVDT